MVEQSSTSDLQAQQDAINNELRKRGQEAGDALLALVEKHGVDAFMDAIEQAANDAPTKRLQFHLRKVLPQMRGAVRTIVAAAKEAKAG